MNDRIKDQFRTLRDPRSGYFSVMQTEHRRIHDGDYFMSSNLCKEDGVGIPTLGGDGEKEFLVDVGDDPIHFRLEIEIDKSQVIIQPFEGVTIEPNTENGDVELPIVAANRTIEKDCSCGIYELDTPHGSADEGDDYAELLPWLIEAEEATPVRKRPVIFASYFEYILRPNTKYAFNFDNKTSTEISTFEVIFSWYVER